jgi:hypothetical protein
VSEPVKVLPMAKLLRLAREKDERERAQKEGEASASIGSVIEHGINTQDDSISQDQPTQQTIVQQTIPQVTIVEETISQDTIVSRAIDKSDERNRKPEARQQKKAGRDKEQPSEITISPQTIVQQNLVNREKGYYAVFNDISDRLIPEMQLDPYQQAVLQRLYRLSRGWQSEECEVGLGTLARYCVMSRSQVQRSVAKLIEKGLLESLGSSKKGGKEGTRYKVLPGLKSIPRRTIPGETIVPRTMVGDTIVREDKIGTHQTTVVSQGIVPRGTNKNSNKELVNTHTQLDVCVGSKFSLEECRRFAEHLQKTGQGINNPGGYATTIFRSGEFDEQIEAFLKPLDNRLESSSCPDCGGTGYYYPEGVEKGVIICKHDRLKAK